MIPNFHSHFSDKLGKLMKNKNKPGLFAKKPGKGGGGSNCDCPCREYWTTRCAVEYKTECKQLYTHRDCKKVPVKKPMRVRETECQKCVKFSQKVSIKFKRSLKSFLISKRFFKV